MYDESNRDRRYPSDGGSERGNDIHPAVELLSEYLDAPGELGQVERDAVEGHLAGCRQCQATLSDLQRMVQTLGTLPEQSAPRSFALTWEMIEPAKAPVRPAPVVLQESTQWHMRHAAKVRWATAVAAILFVFVISADLMTNGLRGTTGSDDDQSDMVTMSLPADESARSEGYTEDVPESEPTDSAAGAMVAEEEAADSGAQPESDEEAVEESDEALQSDSDVPATDTSDAADGESADEAAQDDNVSALSVEPGEVADEPQPEAAASDDSSQMRWRIAEVSLALVLALLLAVMIGLPRQRGARRR